MASAWLREINTTSTGTNTGIPFFLKCVALFCKHVLGFTNEVESVLAGNSFFSTEKSGTNGEINLTGTDKNFRDTVASSFVAGDHNKWLLVIDPTNPRNSGVYKATFVSADTMTLDFRSGAAEYPTANTGLHWYLLADNYQVPITNNDYFTIDSPAGWSIEIKLIIAGGIAIRVSTNSDWTATGKIIGPVYCGSPINKANWCYCEGDTAGTWINIFGHNSTDNLYYGSAATSLDGFDTYHASTELIALLGCASSAEADYKTTMTRDYSNNKFGHGYVWREVPAAQEHVYFSEITCTTSAAGLTNWAGEVNARRGGSRNDCAGGSVLFCQPDYNGTGGILTYDFAGRCRGHYQVRSNLTVKTAFNDVASLDRFHIGDGIAINWPNLTQQH